MPEKDIRDFSRLIQVLQNEALPYIFDVELTGMERLVSFDSVECHAVVYPYGRQVEARHMSFRPYEEYVKDIEGQQRSSYSRIGEPFRNIFGILLGSAILLIFACFKPEELLSVESIISVFGAYTIGKEIWGDLENWLIKVTDNRKLRFMPRYYLYKLERYTTVTRYARLARRHRYGLVMILPDKIDFIEQSNAQTVRMYFDSEDYSDVAENRAHILSIHINPEVLHAFEETGYLLGFKISLNHKHGWWVRSQEFFQSFDGPVRGCLDSQGKWVNGAVLCRRTVSLGRWKWYQAQFVAPEMELISRT